MTQCCEAKASELGALHERQKRVLYMVLAINLSMFVVEVVAGVLARSTALLADSLDMLGDTLVYGLSLYAVGRGVRWRASAALVKGLVMGGFGLAVLAGALYGFRRPVLPVAEMMGGIGFLALIANLSCLGLLWRCRSDDLNLRSAWLCSRNDVIANTAVLGAAAGVWAFGTSWPDLIVGAGIAALFLRSAQQVVANAAQELRKNRQSAQGVGSPGERSV